MVANIVNQIWLTIINTLGIIKIKSGPNLIPKIECNVQSYEIKSYYSSQVLKKTTQIRNNSWESVTDNRNTCKYMK